MIGWRPHVEVWLLVAGLVGLGIYATRVIGPKVVPAGQPAVTGRQKLAFVAAVVVLWAASDWPVHDVAEQRLYSVHMVQHLLLTFVLPPLLLLSTPAWLARLVVGDGAAGRWVRRLAGPVAAGVIFNAVAMFTHWPVVVNASVSSGPAHYGLHLLVVATAVLMWTPVCGPLPELRISRPAQMVYLFLMSIVPTVPAAWLTFADGAVYSAYDQPVRLWGLSVTSDQQAAGLIMKLAGGGYLWAVITVMFFRWAAAQRDDDQPVAAEAVVPAMEEPVITGPSEVLTWDEVERELERLGPAPRD